MKKGTVLLLILIVSSFASLADEVLINSKDWKDVYSGMQYGFLSGKTPKFITGEKHATVILNEIRKQGNFIEVYSSRDKPFIIGYESLLLSEGYDAAETTSRSLSIELAKKLTNVTRFIIIDDSYGYNAVAASPYAMVTDAYVLFADRSNIGEIVNFLESRTVSYLMIYGHVDREVRERLAKFNPEVINNDGDRFENNIDIVEKYKEVESTRQVILTNGEFLEGEILSGNFPVLFIGQNNVPEKIREYIVNSDIEVGVLIGNDLVGTASVVRRQTGISTFVKFARSARQPQGAISQVEGLDIFRVPRYELSLSIDSVRYNAAARQLEVSIKNDVDLSTYLRGTYTLTSGDQEQTVGDVDPVFLEGQDTKTVVYDIDPIAGEEDITARVFIIYGESKGSLERILEGTYPVDRIDVLDDTSVTIQKVVYNKGNDKFHIYLTNAGDIPAYADTEIIDLLIIDERQTFGSDEVIKIMPGRTRASTIKVELADEDLENNEIVRARAYYGQREDALVKIVEGDFELVIKAFDIMTYLPVALILVLLILILLARKKKKKKKF